MTERAPDLQPAKSPSLCRLHLRFGWTALLVFATLGLVLEALHAYKSPLYLGVDHETRRFLWTLAHAHGIGLALVNLGFAFTADYLDRAAPSNPSGGSLDKRLRQCSMLLIWASVVLPLGFFLGGFGAFESDPGIGVFLAPLGAVLSWIAFLLVALALSRRE